MLIIPYKLVHSTIKVRNGIINIKTFATNGNVVTISHIPLDPFFKDAFGFHNAPPSVRSILFGTPILKRMIRLVFVF